MLNNVNLNHVNMPSSSNRNLKKENNAIATTQAGIAITNTKPPPPLPPATITSLPLHTVNSLNDGNKAMVTEVYECESTTTAKKVRRITEDDADNS